MQLKPQYVVKKGCCLEANSRIVLLCVLESESTVGLVMKTLPLNEFYTTNSIDDRKTHTLRSTIGFASLPCYL